MDALDTFGEVGLVAATSRQPSGERAEPLALEALEIRSGRRVRLGRAEMSSPPYALGPGSLIVAYDAIAFLSCHLALGWPMPAPILDLHAEFRCHTSGQTLPVGPSLLRAMPYFGPEGL